MQRALSPRSSSNWADLLLISAGLLLSRVLYLIFFPANYALLSRGELVGGFLVAAVSFWAALQLWEPADTQDDWAALFEVFCMGTGLSLIVHALLNYFQLLTRSFFLILVGAFFATCLLGIGRRWLYSRAERNPGRVVMVGFHPVTTQIAAVLGQRILGVIGVSDSAVPAGIPFLGPIEDFQRIIGEQRPTHIIIGSRSFAPLAGDLLKLRLSGIEVSDIPTLYEKQFEHVYCRGLYAFDMLLSPSLSADSRTLALQAIYTNLIGLLFLIVLSPLLLMVSLIIFLFSGPGGVLEAVECAGFQRIPFQLLRFRTSRRDTPGEMSLVGKIITRLHLVNLPRLINVVRGEIALFGPRPVRWEFARRLTEIMPFYSIRFFVKPGIVGCGAAPLRTGPRPVSELTEIEHDLYYIKQASPLFDLEILVRSLLGGGKPEMGASELAGAL